MTRMFCSFPPKIFTPHPFQAPIFLKREVISFLNPATSILKKLQNLANLKGRLSENIISPTKSLLASKTLKSSTSSALSTKSLPERPFSIPTIRSNNLPSWNNILKCWEPEHKEDSALDKWAVPLPQMGEPTGE